MSADGPGARARAAAGVRSASWDGCASTPLGRTGRPTARGAAGGWPCCRCTPPRWSSPAPATPAGSTSTWSSCPAGWPRPGVEVEVFTRRTSGAQEDLVELAPGVLVRHVDAGPYEGLAKEELPGQLCAFTAGLMRAAAQAPDGHYDLVHSHYWLSGQVGWLFAERWGVPLVHTMHTMAKVKNAALADGRRPRAARPGHRRAAGGGRGRPAAWRTPTRRPPTSSGTTAPTPTGWPRCRRGSTSSCSGPATGRRAGPARAAGRRRRPALRRPDPAAQGPRRARRGRRPAARARAGPAPGRSWSPCWAGRPAPGLARPTALLDQAEPRWAWTTSCWRARRWPAPSWPTGTARPTWSPCPRTTSPSAWSRWRRRPAAPRSSRPTWAGCAAPWPTGCPGCSCRATTRRRWADALDGLLRDPARRAAMGRAAVAHADRLRLGPDRRGDAHRVRPGRGRPSRGGARGGTGPARRRRRAVGTELLEASG